MRVANNDDINQMFMALLRHKSNIDREYLNHSSSTSGISERSLYNRKCTQLAAIPCCASVVYISFNSISLKGNDISLHHIRVLQVSRTKDVFTYICCKFHFLFSQGINDSTSQKKKASPEKV